MASTDTLPPTTLTICPLNYLIINRHERSQSENFSFPLHYSEMCPCGPLGQFLLLVIFGKFLVVFPLHRKKKTEKIFQSIWAKGHTVFETFFNWNSKHTPSRRATTLILSSKLPMPKSQSPFVTCYWLFTTTLDVFANILFLTRKFKISSAF